MGGRSPPDDRAQDLCTTLDPVFTGVEPPADATCLAAYRERLAAVRAVVHETTPR